MTQQEYAQKKRECWEEYCEQYGHTNGRIAFAYAFDCAYALGKQEKDVEGVEMLMCEKSKVQEAYKTSKNIVNNELYGTCQYSIHTKIICVLKNLFGSKCLPDVPSSDGDKLSPEPKPAEPKNEGTRQKQCVPKNAESGTHSFNHILKDGFRNERRLNMAAQIVASMIGSDDWTTWRGGSNKEIWHNMAKSSLEIADALIAEAAKGESK